VKFTGYKTLVFDCDGVILDSNKVKTEAFYRATQAYGEAAARAMVAHHISHGGVSRYKKFAYFLNNIAPPGVSGPDLQALLAVYAAEAKKGLLSCSVAEGLPMLREMTPHARWLVASGGDQNELRELFGLRGLLDLFDGGVYGSPDTKEEIIQREQAARNILEPALFLGDSRYDHQVATAYGLDFVFLTNWTEFSDWADYFAPHDVTIAGAISNLL